VSALGLLAAEQEITRLTAELQVAAEQVVTLTGEQAPLLAAARRSGAVAALREFAGYIERLGNSAPDGLQVAAVLRVHARSVELGDVTI
jgi:hypothetical protein